MKLLIIGSGGLAAQAQRLADAAGLETVLADRFAGPDGADFVLPATEDSAVLDGLSGENVLFDAAAWRICSSRFASDDFLRGLGIPVPDYFPGGSEPYLVKPDRGSFGRGIWVTEDFCEVGGAINAGYVAQEELPGPVWSEAVIRRNGTATACAPARLTFDDRRRRTAAVCEDAPEAEALKETAIRIAEALGLNGVLEVEAIFHKGVWTVIDLNARLPMLTADAVLEAAGVNLLAELLKN